MTGPASATAEQLATVTAKLDLRENAHKEAGLPGLPNPLRLGPLRKSAIATAMLAPPPPGHASSNATVVAFFHVDDGDCALKARARANPNPDPPVASSHN